MCSSLCGHLRIVCEEWIAGYSGRCENPKSLINIDNVQYKIKLLCFIIYHKYLHVTSDDHIELLLLKMEYNN